MAWPTLNFRRDGSLVGTLVAFGLSTLVVVVAAVTPWTFENDSAFALAVVMGPVLFLPGLVVLIARLVRGGSSKGARCETCGGRPAAHVRYLQLTGIVVFAVAREVSVAACMRCNRDAFVRTTAHTALLGWWTPLTPLVVPWILLANLLAYARSRVQLGGTASADAVLAEEREYALNLLRTKDLGTVVEVLAKKTGLPPAPVERWLTRIHRGPG